MFYIKILRPEPDTAKTHAHTSIDGRSIIDWHHHIAAGFPVFVFENHDTLPTLYLNSKLDLNLSCAKDFRNLSSMVTWCMN